VKKILLMMFLSLMSINVFGLTPTLKCVPNPCTKDYEACNTNDGSCYCSSGTERMNDGTCDFLGDTFPGAEDYLPQITEPGIYTGIIDNRYTNAYKSTCASGITTINPLTGLPNPIITGKDRIYEMYLSVPQIVTLKLEGISDSVSDPITLKNPVLSILKASNKEVIACHDNISLSNKNSQIIEKNLPAGVYYVVVDTVNTTDYGKYKLDVTYQGSCLNISCGNNGDCVVVNNIAQCNCNYGYSNPYYNQLTCVSVCANKTCPSNSVCVVSDTNQGICDCNIGYSMTNGLCVDNCSYYTCGTNGACIHTTEDSDEAECICNDGYSIYQGIYISDGVMYRNSDTIPVQTTCAKNEYWGGSVDTHMGESGVFEDMEDGFRNDRFNWWVDVMDRNTVGYYSFGWLVFDPHELAMTSTRLITHIFDNVIWYNVTHGYHNRITNEYFNQECYDSCSIGGLFGGSATCRVSCTTYTHSGERYEMGIVFGDWDLKIKFNEIFPENSNEENRLTWFTTTACHSGDNEGRTDENGKKFYTIWEFNVKNMLSLNTVKNPNGYFGTDGLFSAWYTTNEQGEDFADEYLNKKSHLKYAWKYSYEDWWIRNDSRIVYTGKDKSDCFGRMGKDYYNPDRTEAYHRQDRLPQSEIKNYCYRLYYNNWDEDPYKGNGELD